MIISSHTVTGARPRRFVAWSGVALFSLGLLHAQTPSASFTNSPAAPGPVQLREFFNAGTKQLRSGKLREAEAMLETVVASQSQQLQPSALYNLGHVRFAQGVEALKKAPPGGATVGAGRGATQHTDDAIGIANEALAGDDVQKLVAAYLNGR